MQNKQEEIEIWKDVPGYEGLYQVSDLGRVKRLARTSLISRGRLPTKKEKILKYMLDVNGYSVCSLYLDGKGKQFKISVLVAMAFLGHKPDGTTKIVCDHINNVKTDNRLYNLQLISQRENSSKDAKNNNSTSKYTGVSWDKKNKKWVAIIQIEGKNRYLGHFLCEIQASEMYQKALKNLHLFEGENIKFKEQLKRIK